MPKDAGVFDGKGCVMLNAARRYLRFVKLGLKGAVDLVGSPRRKLYGPITDVLTSEKIVALTFDDGPHPVYTPRLLNVLQHYRATATFFMLGGAAHAHPEVVEIVAKAGHALGNHSYSHCDFRLATRSRRREEILECSKSLHRYESKIFRPPYGSENMGSHFDARNMGYAVVKWNIAVGDWEQISGVEIARRIVQQIKPGAIVLLHDSIAKNPQSDRSSTIEAVERLLEVTRGEYTYCSIPELFRFGRPRTSFRSIKQTRAPRQDLTAT